MKLEIRNYYSRQWDNLIQIIVLFLFGYGFFMIFVEVDNKIIARYSILIGVLLLTTWYFFIYFFRKPEIKGFIIIDFDKININGDIIRIEEVEYLAINYRDFRGRIILKRIEYPLPKFGTNNEIKLIMKSGQFFESNFYIARKNDRKKIDRFLYNYIEKGVRIDYLVDGELIETTGANMRYS